MRRTVASRLSVDLDLSGFYEAARDDPVLKHAVRDLYGMHPTGPASLFASCGLAITLQMAPRERSESMMRCLVREWGDAAAFDGHEVTIWPDAGAVAETDPGELRERCRLGYRAEYLVGTAERIGNGFPTLEELEEMGREEARERLTELPGIGDYSADIVNPHGGFPIDSWSAEVFAELLFGEDVEGRDAVERVKTEGRERWGQRAVSDGETRSNIRSDEERFDPAWLAFLYVVHDLENLSKELDKDLRIS